MKDYTGILITPERREIREVNISRNGMELSQYYELLGCQIITAVYFARNGDACFVDDEGLLKPAYNHFWIPTYPQPLAGNGLVLGSDDEGESVTPKTDIQWLKDNVVFIERLFTHRWGWYAPGKPDEIISTDALLERTGAQ